MVWHYSAVTYTTACARAYGFVFERHQRSGFFVEKLYGMHARALAVHACARARGAARDDGLAALSATRRQRRKVDKCRVADKKQTDRQTNTHYFFIGIDELTKVGSDQRSSTKSLPANSFA